MSIWLGAHAGGAVALGGPQGEQADQHPHEKPAVVLGAPTPTPHHLLHLHLSLNVSCAQ